MSELERQLERLQRRLERERAARREAEAIAERNTRGLYDRQQELVLLEAIAATANDAASVEHALRLALERVCRHLGWPLGQAWLFDQQAGALTLAPVGHSADAARHAGFACASAAHAFASGDGLPGHVLASGRPAWVEDVREDPTFLRAPAATAAGLRAAVAFPVLVKGRTVAVLECLSEAVESPSEELLRVLAQAAAERMQDALRTPFTLDRVLVQVDASIGLALYPGHGDDVETLLRQADVAMYDAKRRHAGRLVYSSARDPYCPDASAWWPRCGARSTTASWCSTTSRRSPSARAASAAWRRSCAGRIATAGSSRPGSSSRSPSTPGSCAPLTTYVLRAALAQVRRWLDDGLEVPVAVNVAARSLLDAGFADEVAALLDEAGVAPGLLELEVTESSMLEDPEKTLALLDRLSRMGIAIAIDDFGTGYSSMAQLKRLPVRDLKIDRGFVAAMLADERDAFIVRSTIQLGHDLGLCVVAEGVEDRDTLRRLHALGCDTAQGYLIQRPVPADELTAWLRGRGVRRRSPAPARA